MKTIADKDLPELVRAARIAQPEGESLWDRVANYFDARHGEAAERVEPRATVTDR